MVYLDQLSFHTDYNKAVVRQKTREKRFTKSYGGTEKKNKDTQGVVIQGK